MEMIHCVNNDIHTQAPPTAILQVILLVVLLEQADELMLLGEARGLRAEPVVAHGGLQLLHRHFGGALGPHHEGLVVRKAARDEGLRIHLNLRADRVLHPAIHLQRVVRHTLHGQVDR